MISKGEADRVEQWVAEAREEGAIALTKPKREGNTIWPVLLENVGPSSKVSKMEVFGPVALLAPYETLDQAIQMTNDSEFGLQAGIFTKNIDKAFKAYENIETGGVVLNNAPTTRADHMPYGGVKESGEGREGPKSALEHMSEERVLVIQR
jgi:acyl-CoA reductase-like NAD-dependent aldehyde dehydrogenase